MQDWFGRANKLVSHVARTTAIRMCDRGLFRTPPVNVCILSVLARQFQFLTVLRVCMRQIVLTLLFILSSLLSSWGFRP